MNKQTKVVSFFGGPGCGKSTLAAKVYSLMKERSFSVELVREYVKAWAWRGDKIGKWDELYIFAKQLREESNLYGKVDYIITDRPLGMSAVYDRFYNGTGLLIETSSRVRQLQKDDGIIHTDLIVKRTKAYVTQGRFESETMARDVDMLTHEMFPNLIEVSTVDDVMVNI